MNEWVNEWRRRPRRRTAKTTIFFIAPFVLLFILSLIISRMRHSSPSRKYFIAAAICGARPTTGWVELGRRLWFVIREPTLPTIYKLHIFFRCFRVIGHRCQSDSVQVSSCSLWVFDRNAVFAILRCQRIFISNGNFNVNIIFLNHFTWAVVEWNLLEHHGGMYRNAKKYREYSKTQYLHYAPSTRTFWCGRRFSLFSPSLGSH